MTATGDPSALSADVEVTDTSGGRILVVDDAPVNCEVICAYLQRAGYTCLETAADGAEAMAMLDRAPVDLLILDLSMPRMDGFEVCRRVRAAPGLADLPILVQTVLDQPDQRARAFEAGATDLVAKPINHAELVARVRIHLERRLLIADLKSYRDRLARDLDTAREMQRALIPAASDVRGLAAASGLDVATHFQPSDELGGDLVVLRPATEGGMAALMVDFSGHGVTAALNTFRLHSLIDDLWAPRMLPSAILAALNERLVRLLPVDQFATALAVRVDPMRLTVLFSAASAPAPLVLGRDGSVVAGDASGLPLGVSPAAQYEDREMAWPAEADILLASDAFTTATDLAGNSFEEPCWQHLLATVPPGSDAATRLRNILAAFVERTGPDAADDQTAVIVRRSGV